MSIYLEDVRKGNTSLKSYTLRMVERFLPRNAEIKKGVISLPELDFSYDDKYDASDLKKIEEWENMSPEEASKRAKERYQESLDYYNQRVAECAWTIKNYEALLDKVNNWEPPTEKHEDLKAKMVETLEHGIEREKPPAQVPEEMTGEEYREMVLSLTKESVKSRKKYREQQIESRKELLQWIEQLQDSLKDRV